MAGIELRQRFDRRAETSARADVLRRCSKGLDRRAFGRVIELADIGKIITQVVQNVPDTQIVSDLDAAVAFAKASGKADVERLGVTGFCWGGRATWVYAAHNKAVKAAVAWCGPLKDWKTNFVQEDPVQLAPRITVPVLGLYAGADEFIPDSTIIEMRSALGRSPSKSELVVYPGVPHGFNADYRPTYLTSRAVRLPNAAAQAARLGGR